MKLKTFIMTAIMCGALFVGLGGTTSATELSKDFSALNVVTQELASRQAPIRYIPPRNSKRHYEPPRRDDYDRTGNRNNYNRNRDRNVTINVSITRKR